MNKIELRPIKDLLDAKFFIPNYQRGYRWKQQQVEDLLNDIQEFMQLEKKSPNDFYCIQPLVVKETVIYKSEFRNDLSTINENDDMLGKVRDVVSSYTQWEVIDGQQRLTTIYLLLKYLQQEKPAQDGTQLYSLKYATRDNSEAFLKDIQSETKTETETDCNNIDYYYMFGSYKVIKTWFEEPKHNQAEFQNDFLNTILDNVKFIWYESVESDPIKVFTRLNIGKIALTNAELVKALFLNQANFPDSPSLRLRQQEIASQWDRIEYTLQNDEFWLFLNQVNYDRPTRIDMILDIICERDKLELKPNKDELGNDQYKTFRYFYKYFKGKDNNDDEKIKKAWSAVTTVFQTFEEWYNDIELYHYVGYLIANGSNTQELFEQWNGTKQDFLKHLHDEIISSIDKCNVLDKQYEVEDSPKTQCKPLLLLHNIQTVINQNKSYQGNDAYILPVFYKFPFHLYKLEKWDVEHIDSNTENEFTDDDSKTEYLVNCYLGVDESLQTKIKEYFNNPSQDLFDKICKAAHSANDCLMNDDEKNQIYNFTLLDSSTNRSYGNSIFSAKRRIIIGKDCGKYIGIPKLTKNNKLDFSVESNAPSSFIPPCTKQVFMKYYSPASNSPSVYTKSDAEAYRNNIYDTLKDFGVKVKLNNNAQEQNDGK